MRSKFYILCIVLGLSILTLSTDSQQGPGIEAYTNPSNQTENSQPTTNNSAYCYAGGESVALGWIEDVIIGQYEFNSGSNSGYANLTNKEFDIECGAFNSFDIKSGQPNIANRYNWRVWIDYDQSGSFENVEQIISNHSVNMKGLVYIPSISKLTYRTGMRIAMSKDDIPGACGTFKHGEVEDYTVVLNIRNFESIKEDVTDQGISKGISTQKIKVYPNPSSVEESLYLEYEAPAAGNVSVTIFNIDGRLVESVTKAASKGKNTMDIKGMITENGVYLIKMQIASQNYIKKITIID